MFRQRLYFFRTVLLGIDLALVACAWLLAYHLRLTSGRRRRLNAAIAKSRRL